MKKNFTLSDCQVRLSTESDIPDLIIMAKGIWDGESRPVKNMLVLKLD